MKDFVVKRYINAGVFADADIENNQIVAIYYAPFDGGMEAAYRKVELETHIPAKECPANGDIVCEFPSFLVWMPREQFDAQFSEV